MDTFGCKSFAKPTICFFWNFGRKYFVWLSEKSQRGFQAAFYLSLRTFWRNFFWKFLHFLWTFIQIISGNWAGKVWPACQNCILRIYKIISKKKISGKQMKFFIIFRHWAGKISASFRVFRRGRWSCILGVQNNILTKNSLISSFLFILGHWGIFLPILAKKVAEFSKLDSQFQWILSGARVFCKTYKLLFSWISSGNISAGCPKKVSGAFKLLSTSPWEHFEETFFEKFLHLLWTFFRIISSNWARKFFSGLSKLHSSYL